MTKRIKMIGPPGTGKTYRLVNHYLKKEIEEYKTPHKKILYVGFSNATVDEAKRRIDAVFPGNKINVRTLHSFGKYHLNHVFEKDGLLNSEKSWQHFSTLRNWGHINFASEYDQDAGYSRFQDWKMKTIEYAKNKKWGMDQISDALFDLGYQDRTQNIEELEQLWLDIDNYKQDYKKHQFSDMIEKFVEEDCSPSLECIFLDEAQDLNPLEWSMIEHLEKLETVARSYVAGDDDQAIYAFKGGEASTFINLQGEEDPQIKSNRVPRSVHREALKVLGQISQRIPKLCEPREESVGVYPNFILHDINFNEGEWLIMTRRNNQQGEIIKHLEDDGQYIISPKSKLLPSAILKSWRTWDLLNKGEVVEAEDVKRMYNKVMGVNTGQLKKKPKHEAKSYTDGSRFDAYEYLTLEELKRDHGLLIEGDWKQLKIELDTVAHIESLLEKGVDLHAEPRIRVSTIHKMKGGEADNVILFTDMTDFIFNQTSKRRSTRDTEHRVWFVAITRAKKALYYMQQGIENQYVPGKDIL